MAAAFHVVNIRADDVNIPPILQHPITPEKNGDAIRRVWKSPVYECTKLRTSGGIEQTTVAQGGSNVGAAEGAEGLYVFGPRSKGRLRIPCKHHNSCGCYEVDLDRFEKNIDKLHAKIDSNITTSKGLITTAFGIIVSFGVALLTFLPNLYKPGPNDQYCCAPTPSNLICCPTLTTRPTDPLPSCCRHAGTDTLRIDSPGLLFGGYRGPREPRLFDNGTTAGCAVSLAAKQYRSTGADVIFVATLFSGLIAVFLTFKVAELVFYEDMRNIYRAYLRGSTRILTWQWVHWERYFCCDLNVGFRKMFRHVVRMICCSYMWLVFGTFVVTGYGASGVSFFDQSEFCNMSQFVSEGSVHARALQVWPAMAVISIVLAAGWMFWRRTLSHDVEVLEYVMRYVVDDVLETDLKKHEDTLRTLSSWNRTLKCDHNGAVKVANDARMGVTKHVEKRVELWAADVRRDTARFEAMPAVTDDLKAGLKDALSAAEGEVKTFKTKAESLADRIVKAVYLPDFLKAQKEAEQLAEETENFVRSQSAREATVESILSPVRTAAEAAAGRVGEEATLGSQDVRAREHLEPASGIP